MTIRTLGCLAVIACTPAAMADVYYDAVGDIAVGNANLDITQVEVTDDGTDLSFTVSLNAWEDWTKVLLFVGIPGADSVTGENNPWNRAVSTDWGVSRFVGSYFDSGDNALYYQVFGSSWNQNNPNDLSMSVDRSAASITYTLAGVASAFDGETISFDVATTGGNEGDPGIDLASTSTVQPAWGQGTSQSATPLTYTIGGSTPVVPGVGGLAVLAGLGLAGRRRR